MPVEVIVNFYYTIDSCFLASWNGNLYEVLT